jgi:hypothetical protein
LTQTDPGGIWNADLKSNSGIPVKANIDSLRKPLGVSEPASEQLLRRLQRHTSLSGPETGFGDINGNLPEADLWLASLRVHPGHNFRVARHPIAIGGERQFHLEFRGL